MTSSSSSWRLPHRSGSTGGTAVAGTLADWRLPTYPYTAHPSTAAVRESRLKDHAAPSLKPRFVLRCFTGFLILVVVAGVLPGGARSSERVVGGTAIQIEAAPWAVWVENTAGSPHNQCAGTVIERPRQLWQLDLSSVWVAEHGWTYLMAMIDCCTREIVGWQLELRCRADEAIAVVEQAALRYGAEPGELVRGSDNGSAFTARRFKARLTELGIKHRRGGYRDPESQAFIESWFGKLKEREVWLNEHETLDDARRGIGGYVDRYHHRPHSSLNYRTPLEVRQTWEDLQGLRKSAA